MDDENKDLASSDMCTDELRLQMKIVNLGWKSWKEVGINLNFQEIHTPRQADIRITFKDDGSWSYVGGYNSRVKWPAATMNFGWDLRGQPNTVEHEIGHAIGLEHEHQNPNSGIKWDEALVISHMKEHQGWTEEDIRHNILNRIEAENTNTVWDRDSIMHYEFEQGLILLPEEYKTQPLLPKCYSICRYDESEETLKSGLSPQDREFVRRLYPPMEDVHATLEAETPRVVDKGGKGKCQLDFNFVPPDDGEWIFKLDGADDVEGAIAVADSINNYDIEGQHGEPFRLHVPMKKNETYIVTVLLGERGSKEPLTLTAFKETQGR